MLSMKFRAMDLSNQAEKLNTWLWRFSRYPDDIGDCLMWWGYYLLSLNSACQRWWTIIGPVIVTNLLISRAPALIKEIQRRKPNMENREFFDHNHFLRTCIAFCDRTETLAVAIGSRGSERRRARRAHPEPVALASEAAAAAEMR